VSQNLVPLSCIVELFHLLVTHPAKAFNKRFKFPLLC
jgi:hypothetical protein